MKYCECGRIAENKETGLCASCAFELRKAEKKAQKPQAFKTSIQPVGAKQKKALSEYSRKKAEWIQGKRCAIYPFLKADQVHHRMGRVGFADQWARERGITLLLDERFWLPVSMRGHQRVELNPQWAREKGYSLARTEILQ